MDFQSRLQTRVASLSAALSDVPETTRLLAEVPPAEAIREKLAEPLLFQHWDDLTERAIWIASDGSRVRCVTVTGPVRTRDGGHVVELQCAHFAGEIQSVTTTGARDHRSGNRRFGDARELI